MSNKKQTAVEWLVSALQENEYIFFDGKPHDYSLTELIAEAKELEKQQHGQTWDYAMQNYKERGGVFARAWSDFDDYYNETYGGKNG